MSADERAQAVAKWEGWRRALYEERAGIRQFCGGMAREQAERLAFEEYRPRPRREAGRVEP